ncbi:MAG TPA: hypothetical protein VEL79_01600 [Vicinamibacterales bacterium]|nr:hypothetical protein [Vicinamibacterales bacterium]
MLQFARRDIVDVTTGDEKHWSLGVNYWWAAHNANVKGAFGRVTPAGLVSQNQLTIQFQLFYF